MRPTAHRLDAPRVLASMVSLAGRQDAWTNCESPPRQPGQGYRSALNQSASTHPGQPGRASTQGSGTPQTPFRRVFWPPRLLRARVDRKSGETGEGGRDFSLPDTFPVYRRSPNREWTAISWSPGRGAGPFRRGRQCLPRKGDRPRSSTPCRGGHTAGTPKGRPRRRGGGAQNRAFVLAHLLPPVNKLPLPAWVAADSVSAGSGSRDPASSGCALHSALADLLQSSPLGVNPWHPLACLSADG